MNRKIQNRVRLFFLLLFGACVVLSFLYPRVQKAFGVSPAYTPYMIATPKADTLLVAFIGDSWAELHDLNCNDIIFENRCARLADLPVKCIARGQGGRMTREIYDDMFVEHKEKNARDNTYFIRPLLEQHPNYCVIMAGINDIWQQRSTSYYIGNYVNIIRFLLHHNIIPVVLEIPDVNIARAINGCDVIRKAYLRMISLCSRTEWDNIDIYREAMLTMLDDSRLKDSVIFIPASDWDASVVNRQKYYYQEDEMHLTTEGYRALDSCIADRIIKHELNKDKQDGQ